MRRGILIAALAVATACGDTLVDHRAVELLEDPGGAVCTDATAPVACTVDAALVCKAESPASCGETCADCTRLSVPANAAPDCLPTSGGPGQGACGFACTGGRVKCGDGCCGVVELAAGDLHTCARTTAGTLVCWGENADGQVTGTAGGTALPPFVLLDDGVGAVAAGRAHTCAATASGVRCFGADESGQSTPPPGLTGVTRLTAGRAHTCALLSSGAVRCWGAASLGQAGGGTPIESGALAITAGADHTCALMTSGAVRCWGTNASGELGVVAAGAFSAATVEPIPAATPPVVAVDAGLHHTCASTGSRDVTPLRCWGANPSGSNGLALPLLATPVQPTPAEPMSESSGGSPLVDRVVDEVSAGARHTCVLRAGEAPRCFGAENASGQLGQVVAAGELSDVGALPLGVERMVSGAEHTCVVLPGSEGSGVACFGANAAGQLGDGTSVTPAVGSVVRVSGR